MADLPEPARTDDAGRALAAKLARIAAFESRTRANPLTKVTRQLSRTAWFASVYRRIGPRVDPAFMKVRDGRAMAAFYGFPFCTLHTTGAKSGQPRESPLLYIRDGDDVLLLGTNFGQPKHPAWTANLLAHPECAVTIGPETLQARAVLIGDEEWQEQFPHFVAIYPGYDGYIERRGGLAPRMFRLEPTG